MARPPKHNPERRNAAVGIVRLPAAGRSGEAPPWPLRLHEDLDFATREEAVWEQLWKTPQAVAWERLGWTRAVARYCRMLIAAETPGGHQHCRECKDEIRDSKKMDASLLAQVTAMEDRLGLTPKAMRLLLWVIDHDEVEEARQGRTAAARRRKFMAVDSSAAVEEEDSD